MKSVRRLLVTGATGLVGGAVLERAVADRIQEVVGATRTTDPQLPSGTTAVTVGDLTSTTDWVAALRGVDAVVHTAARVHVMRDPARDPLAEFRRTNVEGTLNLARQAAASGVRRFVFLSSIKVNGETTLEGQYFCAADAPAPVDAYGISKLEAERGLASIARETGLEVAVVRPVLVYGPGVKGNLYSLMRWLARGVPLPFGGIRNQRSLVALDTLVDLILTCVAHPAAASGTFLVSDGDDLSTPELLRRTARAMGCNVHLVAVPPSILRAGAMLGGKPELARRLCDSLRVDVRSTRGTLGWSPRLSVDAALERMATHFLRSR